MNEQLILKADRMADMLKKLCGIFAREGQEGDGNYRTYCALMCVEIDARIVEYEKEKENAK